MIFDFKMCAQRTAAGLNTIGVERRLYRNHVDSPGLKTALKELETYTIEDIFKKGLHEFLVSCRSNLNQISNQIEIDFGFYSS